MMRTACELSASTVIEHSSRHFHVHTSVGRRPFREADRYAGRREPPLGELLDDPIMWRLMARDGVSRDALLTLIDEVRRALCS